MPRLVTQGNSQLKGADIDETFVFLAQLEFVSFLCAITSKLKFKFFKMGGKTVFPDGHLNEEVNIDSPNGVINSKCSMPMRLYGFGDPAISCFCANICAINISKNLVQHSKAKHIDV